MSSKFCEACGATSARERALENCERKGNELIADDVCVLHALCNDCYERYRSMDAQQKERFSQHLSEKGLGIAVEF